MREIKFRAWNHIVNRMSDSYTLAELHKQEVNFQITSFMQYTGLKDKNGKEIYEGDIVRYFVFDIEDQKEDEYVEEVKFENGGFQVEIAPIEALLDWKVEVIGNIHDNPEFLN